MIYFYSGTPGSGKSYHVAQEMLITLRIRKKTVISTVDVNVDKVSKNGKLKIGEFIYKPIQEITPEFLYEYAYKHHYKGKEGQTLLVMDECQIKFNPREFGKTDRLDWIKFFSMHRHLGYNVTLISQFDRLVDRQIRALFEYEIKHRKINNVGILFLMPITFFAFVTVWYGQRERLSWDIVRFKKSTASIYDSYAMFDKFLRDSGMADSDRPDAEEPAVQDHAAAGGGGQGVPTDEKARFELRDSFWKKLLLFRSKRFLHLQGEQGNTES